MSTQSAGVEVIIPHIDRARSLAKLLDALRAQTVVPSICVADNGSSDGSLTMLKELYPEVRVIEIGTNVGFGRAVNRAARGSAADLIILLNNDTVPDARFVEIIQAQRRDTGAEAVAACLRRPDGTIESLGVEVDQSLIAYDVGFREPWPVSSDLHGFAPIGPSGGAGAWDREAFLSVGGFDERIFAYLEDAELAIRMQSNGKRCALAHDAFAFHEHSGTLGSGSARKNFLMGRSRAYMMWKYGAALGIRDRARGHAIDAIVYAGQVVRDRNVSAVRGRLSMWRELRASEPPPQVELGAAAISAKGTLDSLRIRSARRRRG